MAKPSLHSWREALDLSERETEVYLRLVGRGWGSALDIARDTTLPRTTVKSILDRLVERGLVTQERHGESTLFTPEEPATVLAHEQARVRALEHTLKHLQDEYFTINHGSGVRVFERPRSVSNLLVRIIEETPRGATVCAFESPASQNYNQVMSEELLNAVVQKRMEKHIHLRLLVPESEAGEIRDKFYRAGITVRTLPHNVYFSTSMWIFGKSLVFFAGKQALAVEITHQEMFKSMQSVFDHLWEDSMPYQR